MTVLSGARVVTPDGVVDAGWVSVAGETISAVGAGAAERGVPVHDLGGGWLVPGFVDIHVHGGGGWTFTTGDAEEARRVLAFHRGRGTTTSVASLVSAPLPALHQALEGLAGLVDDGSLAGFHLEGPFLAAARCGAHDPACLRVPDQGELSGLLETGRGSVRQVTVAPELPEALDLIRLLVDSGVVAAVGHSDATYAQGRAAIEAGASLATHLFNAMRPIHHREPGLVTAALEDERVTVEVINDGVHVHEAVVRAVFARSGRVALVTDAMAAAGAGDGVFSLGSRPVRVIDGVAMLSDGSSIAGSTLTMDAAVRRAVRVAGVSVVDAVRAAATVPAAALGLADVGAIAAGRRADFVVLDDALEVRAVMRAGRWEP